MIPIKFQDISRLLDEIGENGTEGVTAFLDSNGFDSRAQILIQNLGHPWKVMFATVYATLLMTQDGFGDLAEDQQMDKVTEQMVSAMCAAAFQLGWACHEQYRGKRVKGNVERTL